MFFVLSSIKLDDSDEIWYTVFWINLLQNHINVSHLIWLMFLHYLVKLGMFIGHMLPLSCYRKKLKNLSHLNCGLQICHIWIQLVADVDLIFNLGRKEHVTPCLFQLHWLPVQFRITHKLCVMMHNIHVGKAPCYLSDALQLTCTRALTCVPPQTPTATPYRIWRPSLENVPSHLLGQLHGTVFLQNCAPYQTVLFLRTSSKPIFLIWLVTFSRFRLPLFVFLYCTYVLVL